MVSCYAGEYGTVQAFDATQLCCSSRRNDDFNRSQHKLDGHVNGGQKASRPEDWDVRDWNCWCPYNYCWNSVCPCLLREAATRQAHDASYEHQCKAITLVLSKLQWEEFLIISPSSLVFQGVYCSPCCQASFLSLPENFGASWTATSTWTAALVRGKGWHSDPIATIGPDNPSQRSATLLWGH